jgi:cyclophilin family peptidyl-prolyl cis-trans isomerase/HEAT repeat protein
MRHALVDRGVPDQAIVREDWSFSTLENARYVAHLLRDSGCRHVSVVTCDWHMPRAQHCFRLVGFTSDATPARSPRAGIVKRQLRQLLERARIWLTRLAVLCLSLLVLYAAGCRRSDPSANAGDKPAEAPDRPSASGKRLTELAALEARRDSQPIGADDLRQRTVEVRRRAARALARIADTRGAELLVSALADEDPEVVRWAAYGLGVTCKGREPDVVRRLALRGTSWALSPHAVRPPPERQSQQDDAFVQEALAMALARCATPEAEHTLRTWLTGPHARRTAAALALGRLAAERLRLDDTSLVALLDAAGPGSSEPLPAALFAFTRLPATNEPLASRLSSIATLALKSARSTRAFAVRALGRAGPGAVPELSRVLESPDFTPYERADAARELGRLGEPGQQALLGSLKTLVPAEAERVKRLMSADFGVLSAVLENLRPGPAASESVLEPLATYPLAGSESKPLARRIVLVRCTAAGILAKTRSLYPALTACDPDREGRVGLLAVMRVLERAAITEARAARWRMLLDAKDSVVRQAAIALMPGHPEIARPHEVLARALTAKEDGVVAAAARVLAAYPDRATEDRPARETPAAPEPSAIKPAKAVLDALHETFHRKRSPDAIETRVALVDAAAALQLLSYKPAIEGDCKSPNPTLREHAERALRLLGDQRKSCAASAPHARPPEELDAALPRQLRLRFTTDVGALDMVLESRDAPVAVARVQKLVRRGFYNGLQVHRVVPGFVAQFGDPGGDGFGGAALPPLPCETSPLRFDHLSVGVALAGRDTGSSQLFVTLGPQPQLDGKYSLIGRAEPGWERLAPGDVIQRVTILP